MAEYHPQELDRKWQAHWAATGAFEVTEDPSRPKFYCLEMFAYPSGHAHVGHVRNYIIGDVVARLKRLQGFNVLHPFGWDAFGLPAENAAIKSGIHPETSTLGNIAHMKGQLQRLGISYAWGRELATCLPDYYRWNQWLFTRMFEKGLAYRRRSTVNWCPVDNTVLANEQVVDGACWRCGTTVVQKDLEQWFFKITHYADDLLQSAEGLSKWPEKVLTMQKNWIGRSEGARVKFPIQGAGDSIEVFTTRIDTIFGATFMMLAPEHGLVTTFAKESEDEQAFLAKAQKFRAQDRAGRMTGEVQKEGFFTGRFVYGLIAKRPVKKPSFATSPVIRPARSWARNRCAFSRKAFSSSDSFANVVTRPCSGASIMNVAPKIVSMRVVNTSIESLAPWIGNLTRAPSDFPIQFRCMVRTFSGHFDRPSAASSRSSA